MKGFLQMLRENFTETFLSVVKFTTLQIFLSLIAYLDFKIYQVDIVATYLQKDLDKEIYIEVPKGVKYFGFEGHY